ncbi:MAG: DUF4926 domain-containing protein [Bacteroidetes bacterium]|nr:MAG: DUF4926 domain-containing protein [Bacteroidota bacterium]
MKIQHLEKHDIVALLKEMPEKKLMKGQIGTVVEKYSETEFEIEFSDNKGKTIALLTLHSNQLMLLHSEIEMA